MIKLSKFFGYVEQYKSLKSLLLTKSCVLREIKCNKDQI